MDPLKNQQPAKSAGPDTARSAIQRLTRSEKTAGTRAGRRRLSRFGVAATEFAVVAPLFFLLVIGMIELGRGLMVQQVLINASRVGAREAITVGSTTTDVQTVVQDYAASVSVPGVLVTVTPDPAAAAAGTMVTVSTSVAYNDISWLAAPWFLSGQTLTADSSMRKEGFD